MPRSLTGRIVAAFALLAVVLLAGDRGDHVRRTPLAPRRGHDPAASLTSPRRSPSGSAAPSPTARSARSSPRSAADVASDDVTVHLLAADGSVVDVGPSDSAPSTAITIPATTKIGDTLTGATTFSDDELHDYAALVLRGPNASQPRAILLSTVDRSGADAIRDVGRTLPIVILVTLAIGAPLAFVLSRSIARPLARARGPSSEPRRSRCGAGRRRCRSTDRARSAT